jgi:hypothetical protein
MDTTGPRPRDNAHLHNRASSTNVALSKRFDEEEGVPAHATKGTFAVAILWLEDDACSDVCSKVLGRVHTVPRAHSPLGISKVGATKLCMSLPPVKPWHTTKPSMDELRQAFGLEIDT